MSVSSNDMAASKGNHFFTVLWQSQISDGGPIPVDESLFQNPSLLNENTVTVDKIAAMPSSTPTNMAKNEAGKVLANVSVEWKPPRENEAISSTDSAILTACDPVLASLSDSLIPSLFESDDQPLKSRKGKQENQAIYLNETPQQNLRKRKHRPKVVQESKSVRTPKPKTPVTDERSPAGKRKYVRKKFVKGYNSPSTTLTDATDLDNSNIRSVRQCLNFELEVLEARDVCQGSAFASTTDGQPESLASHHGESMNYISTMSTIQHSQLCDPAVHNLENGMPFDLNYSVDQTRSSISQSATQFSSSENLMTKHILDHSDSILQKCSAPQFAKGKLASDDCIDQTTNDRHQDRSNFLSNSISTSCMMFKQKKGVCTFIECACISSNGNLIHAFDKKNQLNGSCGMSNQDLHSPARFKKKIKNSDIECTGDASFEKLCIPCNNCRENTMALNNVHVTLDDPQISEQFQPFDKIDQGKSGVTVQNHHPNTNNSSCDIFHEAQPLNNHGICSSMQTFKDNDSFKDLIFEIRDCNDAHLVKPSYIARPKRDTSQSTSRDEVDFQGHLMPLWKSDLGLKVPDSAAMLSRDQTENISHLRCCSKCQIDINFQNSFGSNLIPLEMDLCGDPVGDIVEEIRHIAINETHANAREISENALIPYNGGGVMVPFNGQINLSKKRNHRPKVDLDGETFKVWNLLMGKGGNAGAEKQDSEKENWWKEERKVFHGRVESFIARMHLVQGDRRFSQWKGSVVDSVVGVFLTQNVADHLSSTAFMDLAATFPSKSKEDNEVDQVEKSHLDMEIQMECIKFPDYCKKFQEQMLSKELHDQISQGPICVNEGYDIKSFSSGTEVNIAGISGNQIVVHEPDNNLGMTARLTGSTQLEEADNRLSFDDIASSPNSVVSPQNFSGKLVQVNNGIQLNSLSICQDEDLITGSILNLGYSPSFLELLQMAEMMKEGKFQGGNDWEEYIIPERKISCPEHGNLGISTACKPSSSHEFSASELTDVMSVNLESDSCSLDKVIITNGEKQIDAAVNFSLVTTTENTVHPKVMLVRDHRLEGDSFAQIGTLSSQKVTSLESEVRICEQFSHHNDFQKREKEVSTSESIYWMHSHLNGDNKVEIQAEEYDNLQADKADRAKTQLHNQQQVSNLSNGQRNTSKVFHDVKLSLKNELCILQMVSAETASVLEDKLVKVEKDSKEPCDWEILRREINPSDTRRERKEETMDLLDWEAVRRADVKEIAEAIRVRGMNNKLAKRIQDFLNRLVNDHGSIDLEWLRDVEPDKAKDYLLSIHGLGLKSVECVRLLTLQHLAFPVDTNVGRICVRLGWVPLQPLPESLQLHLLEMYPFQDSIQKYLWPRLCKLDQRTLYELHYQMITFGKVFCTKNKPNCNACPMRGECKHFASAFASARLALPGPEEKSLTISTRSPSYENCKSNLQPMHVPQIEFNRDLKETSNGNNCEPIVEEPSTPEHIETEESAIEDMFCENPDEIPTINLNFEEFSNYLHDYMQDDASKALVVVSPEAASIPTTKLKNISRLRTEHHVYELPDSHPLLEGLDRRESDDPSSYLLAIWTPGETPQSIEPPETLCNYQESGKLCNKITCFACDSKQEAEARTVRGTILIPCRTAMRGSFPLNGTYFQVNEVFADHDSSCHPIDVPREWLWSLPRRTVYFGTSVTTIFKGLTTQEIQLCFWRGKKAIPNFRSYKLILYTIISIHQEK
ncbi:protein ROS1A-like isoform X3 [Zingiber officinale]|uniref:protein ROS1A-like isoform X3 n=1 Tax=Zingiber officinale TaxID=94328 RepID=UPI001C4D7078|nr:protein ROS1A-like isoform X3 [Zingiber officinale]